jgi:hypothetical protein
LILVLARRPAVAYGLLAFVMLSLWLFHGGQKTRPRIPSWARVVSNASPSRWAFEGLLLLESGQIPDPKTVGETNATPAHDLAEADFPAESERMGTRADAIALGAMTIGLAAAAAFISNESRSKH